MEEPLYSCCPVQYCRNNGGSYKTYWYHGSCGGRMKIRYSDITLVCGNCGHRLKIFEWLFSCCGNDHQSKQGNVFGWIAAFGAMGQQQLTSQANIRTAVRQLEYLL